IRGGHVTGVQTCALPIFLRDGAPLVIAWEPPVEDPRGAPARDALLGRLAASVREGRAVLLVLTVARAGGEAGGPGQPRAGQPGKIGRASWRERVQVR